MANKGSFKKNHIPWNKDKKGIHLSPQTEFKKGQKTASQVNTWKGGIQQMTKDVVYIYEGVNKRQRRPKKIYEAVNGSIPKGWILYHLDKDKHNDNINNLIAIPRSILMQINSNRLNANYENITAAIEIFLSK